MNENPMLYPLFLESYNLSLTSLLISLSRKHREIQGSSSNFVLNLFYFVLGKSTFAKLETFVSDTDL